MRKNENTSMLKYYTTIRVSPLSGGSQISRKMNLKLQFLTVRIVAAKSKETFEKQVLFLFLRFI
jgi:hypothetical protein